MSEREDFNVFSAVKKPELTQIDDKIEANKELVLSKLEEREKYLNLKIKQFWVVLSLCVGFALILSGLTYKNLKGSFEKKFSDKLETDLSKLFSEKTNIDRFNKELSKISSTNNELKIKISEASAALARVRKTEESLLKTTINNRFESVESNLDNVSVKLNTLYGADSFVVKKSLPSSENHSQFFYSDKVRDELDFELNKNHVHLINYSVLFYSDVKGDPLAGFTLQPVAKLNGSNGFVSSLGTCEFLAKTDIGGFGRDDIFLNQCFGSYFIDGAECESECKISAGMIRNKHPNLKSTFSKVNVVATIASFKSG